MAAAGVLQAGCDGGDSGLCRRCQAFDIQAFSRGKAPWRGYRIDDIAKSAASGCSFCAYLSCALDNFGHSIYDKKLSRRPKASWIHFRVLRALEEPRSELEPDNPGLNITHLQVHSSTTGENLRPSESPFLEFHVVADPGDPAAMSGDIAGRHSIRNKSSDESIDLIKSWLATCIDNHSACSMTLSGQQIATPTPLPTRCLQVTRDIGAQNSMCIRLVRTAGRTGSYTTLSHRWPAPPKQLQGATTLTNLTDRLSGSETLESRLPRHFVDACMLTLRLGYEYIWIDAVCIIQGIMDDWASEASRMASYYLNSRLTIAATYGDDTIGLFSAETPEHSRLIIRLPYLPRPGAIASEPDFFYLIPSDSHLNTDYEDYVVRGELLSRGWVTQEWVLSRRILCYTPTSVYFQCMVEEPHNEEGKVRSVRRRLHESTGDWYTAWAAMYNSSNTTKLALKNLKEPEEVIHKRWLSVIEAFSQCNLTKPDTDNLMGLVGLADEFGRALVSHWSLNDAKSRIWVGGLWLKNICLGLLWEQVGSSTDLEQCPFPSWHDVERITSVPSWSWASRTSEVKWEDKYPPTRLQQILSPNEIRAIRDGRAGKHTRGVIPAPRTDDRSGEDWELLPCINSEPGVDQARLVDPLQMFPVLCIRGRLISVLIREPFKDDEEKQIAALISNHKGAGRWRKVSLPSCERRICGWVSLDREQNRTQTKSSRVPRDGGGLCSMQGSMPGLNVADDEETASGSRSETNQGQPRSTPMAARQQSEAEPETACEGSCQSNGETLQPAETAEEYINRELKVLLVSEKTDREGSYALGNWFGTTTKYRVLYLRKYTGKGDPAHNAFERIGVGRLFGRDVQRVVEKAEVQDLELF